MLKGTKIFSIGAKTITAIECLVRSKHSNEGLKLKPFEGVSCKSSISRAQEYPSTKQLPLPTNIEDLPSSEKLKFSPQRNREFSGSFISSAKSAVIKDLNRLSAVNDATDCYDCSGAISLSSAMQTNVPFPFVSKGKPTHLNMPGGQWAQNEKYTSEDLNNNHHINTRSMNFQNGGTCSLGFKTGNKHSYLCLQQMDLKLFESCWPGFQFRTFCTAKEGTACDSSPKTETQLTRKDKLKAAVKDYGTVVLVFHVGISLISLGCCYLVVASGVDLSGIIKGWGIDEGAVTAGTAAQFVIAYAIHKAMAPGRIAITLTAVPFVVRKLRKIGFLKPVKPK